MDNIQKTIHNVFFELRMIRSDLPTSDKEIAFTEKLKGRNMSVQPAKSDPKEAILNLFK